MKDPAVFCIYFCDIEDFITAAEWNFVCKTEPNAADLQEQF